MIKYPEVVTTPYLYIISIIPLGLQADVDSKSYKAKYSTYVIASVEKVVGNLILINGGYTLKINILFLMI